MKISEGLKLEGDKIDIPDCDRFDLASFFVEKGFKVGAEIGTSEGVFAESFGKAGLKLFCIDPWLDYPDYSTGGKGWQKKLDYQYEKTKKLLSPYDCILIRKKSMDALADIEDESLDFVYIDGNHDYKYVTEDITEWSKKVKKGGVICGHDYFYSRPHGFEKIKVKEAVDSYVSVNKISPLFILGRKETIDGEKRDNFRSWMFIKK